MRVYLAKSNRADPTRVAEVRSILKQFDCEVVEYTGGQYTNAPLLSCDILLTVLEDLKKGIIGKGLASQIQDFGKKKEIFVVTNTQMIGNKKIFVSRLATSRILDSDDYISHSQVVLNETVLDLADYLKAKEDIMMLS